MKLVYALMFLITTLSSVAQTNYLRINSNIVLLKDSIESNKLISSLNSFLSSAQKDNEENKFTLDSEKVETFILLDEIKGIEKSGKYQDDNFYKPYLTNIVPLRHDKYLVQFSYIGTNKDTSILRASFEVIAYKSINSFVFSSPLLENTKDWKTEKAGNNTFYYKSSINKSKVNEFNKLASSFDLKLKSTNKQVHYYCCDNIIELEKLIGVEYKADYNGQTESVFNSSYGNKQLNILGDSNSNFNHFDPHDLWHDRLNLVISRNEVYKPVDEACAYLYGGSWGMTWEEILKMFKERVASNKNTNWMEVKENFMNFGDNQEKHLIADYVVDALIVQKLEKEKGFGAVWTLLTCGKWQKGNENYYKALEQLTEITKANYNDKVWELIKNSK